MGVSPCLIFLGTGGWNLSFLHARQAFYQLGYIPNLGS